MPTVIGWPLGPASSVLALLALLRPHAATATLAAVIATRRKVLARGRLIWVLSFPASPARVADDRGARNASGAPRTTGGQPWPQSGRGLTIGTEPEAPAGSTCTNFWPCCHWKMYLDATTFSPMLLYFAGPCTVFVWWLCSQAMILALSMLLVAVMACAAVSPTENASAASALMSAPVPPYLAM